MAHRINFDMDVLRTFVTAFELGSFARAADRLGRSQSAVSTQLRKLEDQAGQRLVRKAGRRLALTDAGESMLAYAGRILALNDEAAHALRGAEQEGWVRLGLPQDFADHWLPRVLARFSEAQPRVRVEVHIDRSEPLVAQAAQGSLDLALAWGDDGGAAHAERVGDIPMVWVGPPGWPGVHALGGEPVALLAITAPCPFRAAGIAALDAAGISWRLVFSSPSLSGLWAAAEAGMGITMRTAVHLPASLGLLDADRHGLPALPAVPLSLYRAVAQPDPAVHRLADMLLDAVADAIG